MFRGSVGFKKDMPLPIITTYSHRSDGESMSDNIMYKLYENYRVDCRTFFPTQKIVTRGQTEISHGYLVGGPGYDTYGNDVYTITLTNSSKTILGMVVKPKDEITDIRTDLNNAFEMAETDMTDSIWDMCISWFYNINITLTTTTSQGIITISDGNQSITINSTTNNMRYNANYYDETNNTSTEYSTISDNGWLIDGTYTFSIIDQKTSDRNNIITSLKAKGIANAIITHDTVNEEITMTNGQWSFTIADKNVGASVVYEYGDTLSETNCGKFFEWGNNYGFPFAGPTTTSSTTVNVSGYGPGNYCYSSTFIVNQSGSWYSGTNNDLWGDTTNTEAARQGPCQSGYHIPTKTELSNFFEMFKTIRPNATTIDLATAFALPFAGHIYSGDASVSSHGQFGHYWTSSASSYPSCLLFYSAQGVMNMDATRKGNGLSIRPFKNTTPSS